MDRLIIRTGKAGRSRPCGAPPSAVRPRTGLRGSRYHRHRERVTQIKRDGNRAEMVMRGRVLWLAMIGAQVDTRLSLPGFASAPIHHCPACPTPIKSENV